MLQKNSLLSNITADFKYMNVWSALFEKIFLNVFEFLFWISWFYPVYKETTKLNCKTV